jgi:hypothetical protein
VLESTSSDNNQCAPSGLCFGNATYTDGKNLEIETKVVFEEDLPNGPYSDGVHHGVTGSGLTVYVLPNSTWLDVGILVKQTVEKVYSERTKSTNWSSVEDSASSCKCQPFTGSNDIILSGIASKGGQVIAGQQATAGVCKVTLFNATILTGSVVWAKGPLIWN